MTEQWVPEPPPRGPRYEERTVPTCPSCNGLVRREILALTSEGQQYGPWKCDLHGEVTPDFDTWEIPTYEEEEAYDISDPKHPRHHEVYADAADNATEVDR